MFGEAREGCFRERDQLWQKMRVKPKLLYLETNTILYRWIYGLYGMDTHVHLGGCLEIHRLKYQQWLNTYLLALNKKHIFIKV